MSGLTIYISDIGQVRLSQTLKQIFSLINNICLSCPLLSEIVSILIIVRVESVTTYVSFTIVNIAGKKKNKATTWRAARVYLHKLLVLIAHQKSCTMR